jgi:hypothetical protein
MSACRFSSSTWLDFNLRAFRQNRVVCGEYLLKMEPMIQQAHRNNLNPSVVECVKIQGISKGLGPQLYNFTKISPCHLQIA